MRYSQAVMAGLSALAVLTGMPLASWAGCTVSHQECEYICTQYYPNGVDCRKTKKVCQTVCDDFTVDKGGVDDANRGPKSAQKKEPEPKQKEPKYQK